jgi:hypothetical protein
MKIKFAFKLSNLQTTLEMVLVDNFGDGDEFFFFIMMNFETKRNLELGL